MIPQKNKWPPAHIISMCGVLSQIARQHGSKDTKDTDNTRKGAAPECKHSTHMYNERLGNVLVSDVK